MTSAPTAGEAGLDEGSFLHELAQELFPFNRSLTGNGVRKTFGVLHRHLPELRLHEVPSGTQVLDWVVPDEWNVEYARLTGPDGETVADIADCNVHLVSYSEPGFHELPLTELQERLYSIPDLPEAIPYVTSYYNRTWGWCLADRQRSALLDGVYQSDIRGYLSPGSLTYGEVVLPGEVAEEVLISTYICHPSLANNELSGPLVALGLIRWLRSLERRRYTYRFIFAPETIGAITYIAEHLNHLRATVVAAVNLTCIGDDGDYSYLASRSGNTPLDRIAQRVVATRPRPVTYSYLDRGSDERQYGMPGVDLPMISLMRTKYGAYPGYHTHLDDLTVVTPSGLQGGLDLVRDCLVELEASDYLTTTVLGEPQLGKRGLYHTMHARTVEDAVLLRTHILAYSDGKHSVADIAAMTGTDQDSIQLLTDELIDHGLITSHALAVTT